MYYGGIGYYIITIALGVIVLLRRIMNSDFLDKIMIICSVLYFSFLFNKVFLPIFISKEWIEFYSFPGFDVMNSLNLIPLVGMNTSDIWNFVLNIILFIPTGFIYYYFSQSKSKTILYIFMTSVIIEIAQFIGNYTFQFMWRITDINDVIANVLGGLIGLSIIHILISTKLFKRKVLSYKK